MIPSDIQITKHAARQMRERHIDTNDVMNVLEHFDCFRDSMTDRGNYLDLWHNGVRVTLARDGKDFLTREIRWVIVTVAHVTKHLPHEHGGFTIGGVA